MDTVASTLIEFKAPPNKPVGFQFDVKQWLGDHMVMAMSFAEQGMHLKLMCVAWQEQPPCTLPDKDSQISQWLGISNSAWVNIHKSKVMSAWKKIPLEEDGDGRWVLEGLQRSYLRQVTILSARSMAAHTRWQKEKEMKSPDLLEVPDDSAERKAYVWDMGIKLLSPEHETPQARVLIGRWIKIYGELNVAHVLTELSLKAQTVADRFTYVTAALAARGKKSTQRRGPQRGDMVL